MSTTRKPGSSTTKNDTLPETATEVEAPARGDEAVEPALDSGEQVTRPVDVPATDAPADPAPADAPAAAEEAPKPKSNLVTVVLAHPLDKPADLLHLGLEPKEGGYRVGDEVQVTKSNARSLANAGYAQGVDPEKQHQVDAMLNPDA